MTLMKFNEQILLKLPFSLGLKIRKKNTIEMTLDREIVRYGIMRVFLNLSYYSAH